MRDLEDLAQTAAERTLEARGLGAFAKAHPGLIVDATQSAKREAAQKLTGAGSEGETFQDETMVGYMSRCFVHGLGAYDANVILQFRRVTTLPLLERRILDAIRPNVLAPVEKSETPRSLTPCRWDIGQRFAYRNDDEAYAMIGFCSAFLRKQELALPLVIHNRT